MKRSTFAILGSIIWLVIVCLYFGLQIEKFSSLKPNEIGDFFAGVFAPLALLWLVVGYYQQGEELRNSAKALNLQAQELHDSVLQQKELVLVNREQLNIAAESNLMTHESLLRAAKPLLRVYDYTPTVHGGAFTALNLQIVNSGGPITNVEISSNCASIRPLKVDFFDRGMTVHLFPTFAPALSVVEIEFKYLDLLSISDTFCLRVEILNGEFIFESFMSARRET
jgi:hypothetical protein